MQKIVALVMILAAAAVGFYYFSNTANGPENSSSTAGNETMMDKNEGTTMEEKTEDMMESEKMGEEMMMKENEMEMMKKIVVTYGADGQYSPSTITIKKGETITWENDSTVFFWPASAIHPTHQIYPEFDAKKGTAPGGEWSFTFDKAGTWKYHDHLKPSAFGTVMVTE